MGFRAFQQMSAADKLRERLQAKRDDPVDELQIQRKRIDWSRGVPLPTKDRDLPSYQVEFQTATAIVVPDPKRGEWRIPYISRYDPGDMAALLDEFVRQTDRPHIRFVNVSPDGTAATISSVAGIPDPRNLRDAVHGFEETTETWESALEDGFEEVPCLVGTWEVDDGD